MEETTNIDIQSIPYDDSKYLNKVWLFFFNGHPFKSMEERIKTIPLSEGICGRQFDNNDIGWFCKDCQKDDNCVICQYCFENSEHRTHRVYLKRNVSGCCDCGDHEAWDPKGFCIAHQGFIDEKSADVNLLPTEIRDSSISTIKNLCSRFFSILMSVNKKIPDEIETEVSKLLMIMRRISTISPIFMYEVCRNFSEQKDDYRHADKLIKLKKQQSLINLLMKLSCKFPPQIRKELYNFCMEHLKSRNFKLSLAIAYLKNYTKVLKGNNNGEYRISSLGLQILGGNETNSQIVSNGICMKKLIKAINLVVEAFVAYGQKAFLDDMHRVSADVKNLTKPSSIKTLLDSNFLPELIPLCAKLNYANSLIMLTESLGLSFENYEESILLEMYLLKVFKVIAKAGDYDDISWCKKLASVFKLHVEHSYNKAKFFGASFFNTPLHRALSFFLVNYTFTQLLLRFNTTGDIKSFLRKLFMELFEINAEDKLNQFLRITMYPTLRSIGLILELSVKKWSKYGMGLELITKLYMMNSLEFARYDIALVQLLLACYTQEQGIEILQFIIDSLSQDDNWLKSYFDALINTKNTAGAVEAALINMGVDVKKAGLILDQVFLLLCSLCSNDCIGIPLFLKGAECDLIEKSYTKSWAHFIKELGTYFVKKEFVHAYFKCKQPWVSMPMISSHLPELCQKHPELEIIIKSISESSTVKGMESYRIKPEGLKYYNPFHNIFQVNYGSSDANAEEYFKNNPNIKSFNPLFGNSIKGDERLAITSAVAQTLMIESKLKVLIERCASGDRLTDSLKVYLLKLAKLAKIVAEKEIKDISENVLNRMPYYNRLLTAYLKGDSFSLSKSSSEEVKKLTAQQKKEKLMKDMGEKFNKFAIKNKKLLEEVSLEETKIGSICCGICKEALLPENFKLEPYGKLVFLNFSGTYGSYIRQNVTDLNDDNNVQMKELVIQSCGHYMHYRCLIGFVKSGKNLEQRPEMMHKLCPTCKTPITYLLPPNNSLQDLTEAEIKAIPIVTNILRIIKEKYENIGIKIELEWDVLINLLASIACYKMRSNELNEFDDLSESSWKLISSLLYIIRAMPRVKGTSPKKNIEYFMTIIREGKDLRQQVLEQDYLLYVTFFYILILDGKEMDDFKLSNATGVQIFFLRFYLWQVIMKLNLSNTVFNFDRKSLNDLIQTNKSTIKLLAYPWLIKTTYLKLALYEPGKAEKLRSFLNNLSIEDKFDTLLELLGFSKDVYLNNYVETISTISYTSVCMDFDELIGLTKRNFGILAKNNIKLSPQLQIIFPTQEFQFTHLLNDFMEMEKIHYKRKCKTCNRQVKNNILCLLCGDILCYRSNCCKQNGRREEQIHADTCSGGTGIYLYFWTNEIVLVSNNASCGYPSPYRNKYNVSVDMSHKITFEKLELNCAALDELKRDYLKGRIYQMIIKIKGDNY